MNTGTALITGGRTGLLGQALVQVMQSEGFNVLTPGRDELDLFDARQVEYTIRKNNIDLVINTVAYTLVDQAEENQEKAFRLNRDLPGILGQVCRENNIGLTHYSTDYVFNGKKNTPYSTEDAPSPLCVYGRSKLAGEELLMRNPWDGLLILRSAWLFGPFKTNFVSRMIQMAESGRPLNVIHDQLGSPTCTLDLARYSLELVKKETCGLFHVVNKGQASWCELASEALMSAGLSNRVNPVSSGEYPQQAKRPPYSVLDTSKFSMVTGITPRPWVHALREYIFQIH
ncbi:dTDP-4-dehydrorhamnose reductase [Desulfonatronospira sp.]|nr:dTDP-4-dehydrorhamnose reductase [Desulfonatronospira sp.]